MTIDQTLAQRPAAATSGRARSWAAQMVRPKADAGVGTQASYLTKSFSLDGSASGATLRISALGLYRCFINGKRVGDDQLTPGWTSYWDRLSFQTYDVSGLLKTGENTIEIWLGDGWYRSQMMWPANLILNAWGKQIAAIAEIEVGGKIAVKTDTSWKSGLLPILKSGIYFGEIYDATQEGAPANMGSALVEHFDMSTLIAHEVNGVKEFAPLPVLSQFTDAEGRTVYDFGQNSGGYTAIEVEGERGARVTVEHAEVIDHNGEFDKASMRAAETVMEYVLRGEGVESYRPTFTFFGFRFVRVTITGKAKLKSIVSVPISSAITRTGNFSSANPLVNRLVENTVWSQRSNFIDVPTDCPQRDERLGWSGDAQVFAATACYLHESQGMLRKYVRDLMADQRPDGAIPHVSPDPTRNHEDILPGFYGSTGWGDAICVIPMALYDHYNDGEIVAEALPAMERWVDFVWSISNGPIVHPPKEWGGRGFTFGDWLQPVDGKWPHVKPARTIADDASATIYLYISSMLTARAARIAGNAAIAKRMDERAAIVKTAFAREFVTESGRLVYDDQTSYALAIVHDLIPADRLAAAGEYFKARIDASDNRIGTGFIGTPALLPALNKIGAHELAAKVFLQERVPGWLFQVKTGATTIWERWDAIGEDGKAFDPQMNSYNHYAYGAVCQWLFEAVAGFRPDPARPGFQHILFEPIVIPALSPVAADHDSPKGRVEAKWSVDGDKVTYDIVVPSQADATLILAAGYSDISIDGKPLAAAGNGNKTSTPLTAGGHKITFRV